MAARNLHPNLKKYMDERLLPLPHVKDAIRQKDARALLVYASLVFVGVREVGGNNKGPIVELIQLTVGGKAEREAWCMGFVQTCIAWVEVTLGIKSPIIASEHCLTTFNAAPAKLRVNFAPLPGAVCIWQHGETSNGHTGIVEAYHIEKKVMYLIEGNTTQGVDKNGVINRDGGGVYRTMRKIDGQGDMKVLGFLKPFVAA